MARLALDEPHPLASAARHGFQHHREANLLGGSERGLGILDGIERSGHRGNADLARNVPCCRLRSQFFHRFGRRTDERDVRLGARAREGRVLGEESVAGMNRIAARRARHADDFRDREIALARRRGANGISLVRQANVQGGAIRLAVNGDGRDTELAAGAQDAHGDLAAIGDQDFPEHPRPKETQTGKNEILARPFPKA